MQPVSKHNVLSGPVSRIALWLVVISLCWCYAGTALWGGARAVCYHYLKTKRQHPSDTLYISAALLKGSHAELVWMKKDEIRFRGKMFDIKQTLAGKDGMVSLVGHYDTGEDKLFKILKKLVGDDENKGKERSALPLWHITAIIPSVPGYPAKTTFITISSITPYAEAIYHSRHIVPPVPPPDVVAA